MHFRKVLCSVVLLVISVLSVYWMFYGESNVQYIHSIPKTKEQDIKISEPRHGKHVSTDEQSLLKNIQKSSNKSKNSRKVLLVIGILSAPTRQDRRQAIRQTWMQICKQNPNVVCRFFTDSLSNMDRDWKPKITEERSKYTDIELMPIPRGINFGLRMLWLIDWSISNYNFEFFLRLDDDYFVCLERLLKELETRKANRLYWGFIHCHEGQVRADEAFMILSKDIAKNIQQRKNDLFCSPFGDQSVAMWIKLIDHVTFFHDNRLLHTGLPSNTTLDAKSKLCHAYIGLHNIYPNKALEIWKTVKTQKTILYDIPSIKPFEKICKYSKVFDWRTMENEYRFKPDPCSNKPVWKDMKMWGGKGGGAYIHWSKRRIIVN